VKFAPLPFSILGRITGLPISGSKRDYWDALIYDRVTKSRLGNCGLFIGWAGLSLASATEATRRGAKFVLDRACPHVDFQEKMNTEEATKTGYNFQRLPESLIERQKQEYERADVIVVPSSYTRKTFPESLQHKIIIAPLFGKFKFPKEVHGNKEKKFIVGVIGNSSLRKGYIYLLQAWRRLNLPNSVLKIRNAIADSMGIRC
jgi:glycosyltransferase involved in cell wall biosynthesis